MVSSTADGVMLALDQGTTNSKAITVDQRGTVRSVGSAPVGLAAPASGWVEQDAEQIWASVLAAIAAGRGGDSPPILGLGLSTQRESVVAWRASTGEAVGPVIGWQDRRTAGWCQDRFDAAADLLVRRRTGLQIDAMFSAPKIAWLLDHLPAGVPVADVRVGTIDSWLIWRLTGGAVHATDAGNASRTLLYDVTELDWAPELLELFGIPRSVLPEVRPSNGEFGRTSGVPGVADGLPVLAVLADSHAALFGQGCTEPGMAKATYGTGTSVMTPVPAFIPGGSPVPVTLAWLTDRPTYAREGNILSSGAALAWTAGLLTGGRVDDLVRLAATVPNSGEVTLVPAFSGLGAPHWDRAAQAVITGLSQGSGPAHLARAAVDAVAHQVCDVVDVIVADSGPLTAFRADGGATVAALVMQTQADLLGRTVEVADVAEVSALGVAQLAWARLDPAQDWSAGRLAARIFTPQVDAAARAERRGRWRDALARSRLRLES